jgi:mannosyltransferase
VLVVQVHWHHRYSGVTTHVEAISAALAKDFEVRWLGSAKPDGVQAITTGEVMKRAKSEKVIWHSHRNNDLLYGCQARLRRKNLRVVFTRHGSYPPGAFSRFVARWADTMITLNEENAGWMKAPSVVIPHGVDTARFSPPASREQAWAALGHGGRYGMGVVGRVRENKGQADFVEAIAPLLPKYPEWRAALVGLALGDDARWAEQLKAKTNGALLLPGETREIVRWYQGFSVLVNPSHGESFGLTMVEGMASGCCVVASKLFHVPKLIEHGRTGFIYEPRDVAGLREVLERLMREPALAEQVGRNAAEEARARLGITSETDAIARVYRALAQ